MKEQKLKKLHKKSIYHRATIEESSQCSCFYCCRKFVPDDIVEWVDNGTTALCPHCGIDSVLPGNIKTDVLREMYEYWFNRGTSYTFKNGKIVEVSEWHGRKKK